ncbi:hypothetical protein AB3M74_04850 [Serratia ureilytica]|uniref:gp53-like domain-containing protein n=1 Tax=Serratia ureilytica TaxID=300181 RepID=UPI003722AAFF
MPIIKKPDYNIFASEAKNGEIVDFPNLLRGWGVTLDQTAGKPPMEWFNALQKRTDEWLTYLSQRGLPEWQNTLDYPKDAVVQFGGKFYVAKKNTKNAQPDRSQNDWALFSDAIGVSGALQKTANLSDVADKSKARGNLGLGTAATRNVGTANGNVMEMGTAGLGVGPVHKDDAYGNIAEFFRINASSANRPGNNSYGGVRLPIDGGPTTSYVVVGADMTAWIGRSQQQANGVTWARVYTTAYKPTAADVGAFPLNGGNVGKDGVVSAGDIKSDKNNIIVKQATQAGGDKGYFIQNGDGANIAFITAYSDGSVRINSLTSGNHNLSFNGKINSEQELTEAGKRVYSPNNPQPISFPVTSVNGRTGAVALNDGFATDGASMWWDAFSSQLRIQVGTWSIGAVPGSSVIVSFPKAFPNYCIFAIPVPDSSISTAAATEQVGVGGRTNTTVTFIKGKGDTDARGGKYLAIGY